MAAVLEQLRKKRPGLGLKQCQVMAHALRQGRTTGRAGATYCGSD